MVGLEETGQGDDPSGRNHGCKIASSGHKNSKPASSAYFLSRSSRSISSRGTSFAFYGIYPWSTPSSSIWTT